jgi:hypothetical protein
MGVQSARQTTHAQSQTKEPKVRIRTSVAAAVVLAVSMCGLTASQSPTDSRFGVLYDARKYPQAAPKEALGSVLKAISDNQFAYLLAHLADPAFVDKRVNIAAAQFGGQLKGDQKQALGFEHLVKETAENFKNDPTKVADLQRFFKDGEWQEGEREAVARLKGLTARKVFMKKAPQGWVLEDKEK